ncbi:MAG: hypothetical protein WCJ56_11620 [bacterium]
MGIGMGIPNMIYTAEPFHGLSAEEAQAARLQRDINYYEQAIDRMTLLNMAMWSILKEKLGVTDEELLKRVEEIDLSDGRLDGKVHVQVSTCPQCNRQMSCKHQRCLYCGYTIPAQDPILKVMAGPMLEENEEVKPLQGTWEEATKT